MRSVTVRPLRGSGASAFALLVNGPYLSSAFCPSCARSSRASVAGVYAVGIVGPNLGRLLRRDASSAFKLGFETRNRAIFFFICLHSKLARAFCHVSNLVFYIATEARNRETLNVLRVE